MKLQVNDLILEVTRSCNLKCIHCLRGDAQRLKMTEAIMDKVLNQIEHIGTVTFSGGDPSLNIPLIEHFTQYCRSKKIAGRSIGPDYFYVVTNGKKNSKALADALIDLYDICDNMENSREEGMGGLAMSRDQYHDEVPIPRIFKALSFFREDDHARKIEYVINEGRAADNGLNGGREAKNHPFEIDIFDDDTLNVEEMLYISANGNVSSDCDLSFKHADETCFGNVLDRPLVDIIRDNANISS